MTSVIFGKATGKVKTKLFVGAKGALKQFVAAHHLEILDSSPVYLYDKDSTTVYTEFENKNSRTMTSIRSDLVQKMITSHCKGDSQVTLVCDDSSQAFVAGIAASKCFPIYNKKSGDQVKKQTVWIDFVCQDKSNPSYDELNLLCNSIRNCQEMVDTPCSELNTTVYVEKAKRLATDLKAQGHPVEIKVISGNELKEQGFGGIYGVGKAAEFPPALVCLSYLPNAEKTLAYVGKGIVFDTGGLSLKQTSNMCSMKSDMGGSAAVFNAFESIVKAKLPIKVHGVLCLAENAIGSKAFKNDDILYMYSGKSVEINNTDAEGRLVLADGVAYATKHLNPDLVLDIATLTGAQLITTGTTHCGILTPSVETEKRALLAGKETGDLCFPMLYCPELLVSEFESKIADLKNSVKDRMNAQSSCAGHFVEQHLHKDYKGEYLHVDIAGPSWAKERGTGFGVALLYQLAKQFHHQ